jgi:hypothetical protein
MVKTGALFTAAFDQSTNQSPSVDFRSHQNSWIFHRTHPPLRPPSTSRASVRSKGKAALAVALGGRSAFYSPTLGHLGMIRRIFPWFQASGTTWGHSCYHNLPSFSPGTEELGTVGREKSATSTGFSVTRHPFTGSSPRCVGHTSSATQSVSPTVAAIY